MTKAAFSIALGDAFENQPADKRLEILRLISSSGSISQAARDAGVSYKAAWQAIDTLTNLAGVVLVERAVGGSGGGGASLTAAGEKLLLVAHLLAEARTRVLSSIRRGPHAMQTLSPVGLRTSMRNQFPCLIDKLQIEGRKVLVQLVLPGGSLLRSRITKASAELLGLKKRQQVLALCKATAVIITKRKAHPATSHAVRHAESQSLSGKVVRASRSVGGDELSILLDSGLQLVGFSAPGSTLKIGAQVTAHLDESAVVLALAF